MGVGNSDLERQNLVGWLGQKILGVGSWELGVGILKVGSWKINSRRGAGSNGPPLHLFNPRKIYKKWIAEGHRYHCLPIQNLPPPY